MVIIGANGNVVTDAEAENGKVEIVDKEVFHRWIVDKPAKTERTVIREYPNGGKDVDYVTISEEVGHWKTTDINGDEVPFFDGIIPDDASHDSVVMDIWQYAKFRPFTEEEIEIQKAAQVEAEETGKLIDSLPGFMEDSDEAICQLYEESLAQSDTIAAQDVAICELYEMMIGE